MVEMVEGLGSEETVKCRRICRAQNGLILIDGPMPEGRMGFPFGRKKKKDDDKESDGREE